MALLVSPSDIENILTVSLHACHIITRPFDDIFSTPKVTKRFFFINTDGGESPLQVIAWPYNGRPGKVNVMRSSPLPQTWIRAQVTFRKVENFFVILFRSVAPKSDHMYLAIDDVNITIKLKKIFVKKKSSHTIS